MGSLLIVVVRIYQACISPFLGDHCRFTPSCSNYAIEAIKKHGSIVGVWYTFYRIIRCQPCCKGGSDPVP